MTRIPTRMRAWRPTLPRTGTYRASLAVGCVLALAIGSTAGAWTHESTGTFAELQNPAKLRLLGSSPFADLAGTTLSQAAEFVTTPPPGTPWSSITPLTFTSPLAAIDADGTGHPLAVTVTLHPTPGSDSRLMAALRYRLRDSSGAFSAADPWRSMDAFNALPAAQRTMIVNGDDSNRATFSVDVLLDADAPVPPDGETWDGMFVAQLAGTVTP
ncbi:hypothetical protein [Leifsonia poae]|uniref:Uncharacterized protein n=1 Tax=Leifsonia poae TaxID=110933 RepID=A0A9W6LYS7_9MICO|nr:hypothetical protein [Leifsonia poae]GLJ74909.1 hypothetical protein GCM10017584_04820 [Leifsonia poae]